jgi:endonuclease I/V8-like Glu-specific endopeptidase
LRGDEAEEESMRQHKQYIEAAVERFLATAPEREEVRRKAAAGMDPREIDRGRLAVYEQVNGSRVGLERQLGVANFVPISFLEVGAGRARSVCCVHLHGEPFGTGFMVTPTLMLTNAHVLPTDGDALNANCVFDYEVLPDNNTKASVSFDLDPGRLFLSSPEDELDYTLVAVKPTDSNGRRLSEFGFIRLKAQTGKALRGQWLNIIQHPSGKPKAVVVRDNQLTAIKGNFLHYETDTEPGSSGSPVMNDSWDVVCLHHSGVPKRDANGNYVYKNGQIQWEGNEGIRISRIVADVWKRAKGKRKEGELGDFPEAVANPQESEEELASGDRAPGVRQSVVGTGTGSDGSDLGIARSGGDAGPRRAIVVHGAAPDAGSNPGGYRIDVTVGVTIHPGGAGARVDGPQVVVTQGAQGGAGGDAGTSEREALDALEAGRRRTYYDRARDESDRDAYYANVDEGSPALRTELSTLLRTSHHTSPSYDNARTRHLYAWVDLQRNKMVRSVYSDKEFDPARFIREDFIIERRVREALAERASAESLDDAALEALRDELEAQTPFNCEHVVPQSWFGKREPQRGDLHHLFSCESDCNSFRGNKPFKDFGKFDEAEALRPKCGFAESNRFEPFMGKGKVARAVLYFLVRYPGVLRAGEKGYDAAGIRTLVEWHERFGVTEHELHRNQAIFAIQGNRNPFIDHADWARRVFGR